MRTKSPITWLVQRLALFSAFLVVCYAENAAAQSRPFINISARADVPNGQDVVIAGFVIQTTATTTKQVLIRGLGPSYGLSLSDPTITLHGPNGVIRSNNNWTDTQQNEIAATGMQPGNNLESAILCTLPAGSYTVTLGSNNGGTGVGLVELYDMGGAAPIVNLSSRAYVGTGDDVLIGGVYVQDGTRAVIRAIGPTLANYGIQGALANPVLELYNAQGAQIALNDNWGTDGAAGEIGQLGLAPSSNLESAILPTLVPGPSTVIIRGANNGTGIGLVELYALEDAAYPRVFQDFADATNLNEDPVVTAARHDLLWTTQNGFGWNWVDANGASTEDYTSETLLFNGTVIPYPIPTLRNYNRNMKILCQVSLVSLGGDRLPVDHAWWARGAGEYPNNRVPAPGGGYLVKLDAPGLLTHVANQAKALMQTGQFDGVMLDSINQVSSSLRLTVLTQVRNAIGENGLIVINANDDELSPDELWQVNGVLMESGKVGTGNGFATWQAVKHALDHNELYTRAPRVNSLETSWVSSRNDLNRMRATTCLGLTHSNGYVLFSDYDDHEHDWYPFWSDHKLGVPTGTHYPINNIADRRDYQNGSAIWNASTVTAVSVTFPQPRKSLATGTISQNFSVPPSDGDIFVINY